MYAVSLLQGVDYQQHLERRQGLNSDPRGTRLNVGVAQTGKGSAQLVANHN